ncbi:MAG: hypothetical protein ACR2RD_08845 [Woeseiaceae bacterium]
MRSSHVLTVSAFSLLAACGGGGGGGITTASPDPTLSIDANNAILVARVSYESALASGGLGALTGDGLVIGSVPGGVNKLDAAVAAAAKTGVGQAHVPIPAETTPCAMSGTVTVSGEIADPITPTLSPGDFFEIDYDACDEGLGDVIDGVMRLDINSFSGDFLNDLFNMTATMTLTMFQVTTGQDVSSSHGDATVTLNTLNSPAVSTSLSGNSMRIDANATSELMTNYTSTIDVNGGQVPSPFTMASSGTLDSTRLSGVISYSTPVDFQGFDADYPSSGEFLVSGGSSTLRLIAIDNINVTIELDTNGDGTVDETIQTTWADMGV